MQPYRELRLHTHSCPHTHPTRKNNQKQQLLNVYFSCADLKCACYTKYCIFRLNFINHPNIDLRLQKQVKLANGQLNRHVLNCVFLWHFFCVSKHSNNWKQALRMIQNVNTMRGIICKPTASVIKQSMNIWSSLVLGLPFNLTGNHHCSIFVIYRKHYFILKKDTAKLPC